MTDRIAYMKQTVLLACTQIPVTKIRYENIHSPPH